MNNRQGHNERKRGQGVTDKSPYEPPIEIYKATPENYYQFFNERIQGQKVRKNAVMGFECVLTFSPKALKKEDLKEWADQSIKWASKTFGVKNIFSIYIHTSEETPHIHILTVPIDEKGKLNANGIIKGPSHLRELQDEYANCVHFLGLERGKSKKITKAEHKKSQQWHKENADNQEQLNAYRKTFGISQHWTQELKNKFNANINAEKGSENAFDLADEILR